MTALTPVSYTHLDVYKRQGANNVLLSYVNVKIAELDGRKQELLARIAELTVEAISPEQVSQMCIRDRDSSMHSLLVCLIIWKLFAQFLTDIFAVFRRCV